MESQGPVTNNIIGRKNLQKSDLKFCSKCGNETNGTTKFCNECGTKIGSNDNSVNLNLNDNLIQRSQIGAASVGNVNIQPNIPIIIHGNNNNNNQWFGLIVIIILIFFIFYSLFIR